MVVVRFAILALVTVSLLACNDRDDAEGQSGPSFSFGAGGDLGTSDDTDLTLAALDDSGVDFFLALGDLDYDGTPTDEEWCVYIHDGLPSLGAEFPFQLLVGNHEEQFGSDGYVLNHASCLPDRMDSTGFYAVEYWFDYPADDPLARFINIPPDLLVEDVEYDYDGSDPHTNWLVAAIDDARADGVPWVIVSMHKNCISAGIKSCEIGDELMNLLIEKKVDLVLQGHDHNYQRSKQLAHGDGCPEVPVNAYDADCVVDSGADGSYGRGAGPVLVISGSVGHCCYPLSAGDPEAPYFAAMDMTSHGYSQFSVSEDEISSEFVRSTGSFSDSFTIGDAGNDVDADGFHERTEVYLGTDPSDPCGDHGPSGGPSASWPADLVSGGAPTSSNQVSIHDLTSYVAPQRRIGTSGGEAAYSARWDLRSGAGSFGATLNIQDVVELAYHAPPMFGGKRAFKGGVCSG